MTVFPLLIWQLKQVRKNGIFPVDDMTIALYERAFYKEYTVYEADEDAVYDEEYVIDLSKLEPTVAFPHLPENTKTIDEISGRR